MSLDAQALQRADGLTLIGEMEGSGYRTPPALVRRADGQTLQVTPLLYALLEAVDGRRTPEEVAAVLAARTGKPVTADNVRTLVEDQLRPLGLLTRADGSEPELKRSNPLLGLRGKVAVTDPSRTRALTDPFRVLFLPVVWVPLVVGFLALTWWLFFDQGLAKSAKDAFDRPLLLLLVFAVTVFSAGFHEFGHAAAARKGGAQPGVMGAGIYLMWPAFYTDVTDSYRLGRVGRLRTDLGGLYFNAIVAVAITGAWWATGWDALLLVVVTQILQMMRQIMPLVRFDGYHVLADLTGVPDLYSRIGPILGSLWPPRWNKDPRVTQLKPWTRAVVTAWVLVTVPVLLVGLTAMVLSLPRVAATAWASLGRQADAVQQAAGDMEVVDLLAGLLSLVAIAFPVLASVLILVRLVRRLLTSGWRRTTDSPAQRALFVLLVGAVVAGLVFAWWPRTGSYRPIRQGERGTLTDLVSASAAGRVAPVAAAAGTSGEQARPRGRAVTVLPQGEHPTRARPMQALVLVPSGTSGTSSPTGSGTGTEAPTWVFPFDRPLPPGEGDNQAVAVNTKDGSVSYDVAMAMVWVEDGQTQDVDNANEAYAFASCSDCVTVAVAFQVVVIVGQADVVVPQNVSAAVNYDCFECITAAVAKQLVVTVDTLPGQDKLVALNDIWARLAEFATTIPTLSLEDLLARLEEFEEQIKAVLTDAVEAAPPVDEPTATPTGSATADPSATPASEEPSPSSTADPSSSSSPTPTGTPTPTGSASVDGTPASEPTPSG